MEYWISCLCLKWKFVERMKTKWNDWITATANKMWRLEDSSYHRGLETAGIQIARVHKKAGSCGFWPVMSTLMGQNQDCRVSWLSSQGRVSCLITEVGMWGSEGDSEELAPPPQLTEAVSPFLPCTPGCLRPGNSHASASRLTADCRCTPPHWTLYMGSRDWSNNTGLHKCF